ncbi:MAG: hypothetical protein DCF16_09435 [Alphaproteobacteria bacterium]|nr:MAG: hypothetical protein DCF16_09435 [Alphaproteobacteria bacterium]
MDHELRVRLAGEAHTRPTVPISPPAMVLHEARFHDDGGEASRAFAETLAVAQGLGPLNPDVDHLLLETADGSWKWERHGEFSTWTFVRSGHFDPSAALQAPQFLTDAPGHRFVAAAVFVTADVPNDEELDRVFGRENAENERVGSMLSGRRAGVWTNFRVGADGWTRFLFALPDMNQFRAGRAMRRLLEIEVYRMAALFALPMAKKAQREINTLERLVGSAIANADKPESEILDALIDAAREAERIAQHTAFRFGAAAAYRRIVDQRLREFREERIEGLQRISAFLDRRFAPAMDTCTSTQTRLETLAKRVERAASLMRTRVDLAMATQNQLQLKSMNENAKAQLRLQRAVEGFSVAAIAYYAFSLASALVAPLSRTFGSAGEAVLKALLVLIIVPAVWAVLKRLREKL